MSKFQYLYELQPLLMQIELTEACNLTCKFCYNSQQPRYNKNAFQMMETLAEQGVMQLTLTGGEPLMHPDFFSILKRATELFPNVMILSNGALMSEENVEKICALKPMSVSISIHGDENTHDILTGVLGSFKKSINAIKHYIKLNEVPIASNFVLNDFNKKVLPSTVEYLKEIGLEFMTITRFVPVGIGATAKELEISKDDMIEAMDFANTYMKKNEFPHIEFAEAVPFISIPKTLQHLANTCSYGLDRFYVDVNGDMMVCGLSRIPLGGNILENTLKEIKLTSSVFQSFISQTHLPTKCLQCAYLQLCNGGCRSAAMRDGNWKNTFDSLCTNQD